MPRLSHYLIHATTAILISLITLPVIADAESISIPSYTLRYKVSIKGIGLGELLISSRNNQDTTLVRGETFPNAFANLIGDGKVVELIEYQKSDNGLKLSHITETTGKEQLEISEAQIAPEGGEISLSGDKVYRFKPDEQIDAYTFPFLTLLGLSDTEEGSTERVVSTSRVHQYQYQKSIRETISVPAGTFDTLKISKQRVNDEKHQKTIRAWVTVESPRYPVKIEIDQRGRPSAVIVLLNKED